MVLNFIEFYLFYNNYLKFFIVKITIFFLVFLMCTILFNLTIIGGGDGKTTILIFLMLYSPNLNFPIIFIFFLIFSIYFIQYHLAVYFKVKLRSQVIFYKILFEKHKHFSKFKKFYLLSTHKLKDLSKVEIYNEKKGEIKPKIIIYNFNEKRLQVFLHSRPPVMLIITLSFISILILLWFK
jgi:hypothetical protein